jgi:UDP-glucose 4-epimerase
VAALERLSSDGPHVINLGTGRGHSVFEIIEAVERVSGESVPYIVGERREGDPPALVADNRLAAYALGWTPRYPSLESMVETAWRWHSEVSGLRSQVSGLGA